MKKPWWEEPWAAIYAFLFWSPITFFLPAALGLLVIVLTILA